MKQRTLEERLAPLGISSVPDPSLPPWHDPPPQTEDLHDRMNALELVETNQHLHEQGYTVIKSVFTAEECDRLAAAVKARTKVGYVKNMLFDEDPLFFEALSREKLMALAEASLGPDFLLMQYSATVYGPGGQGIHPAGTRCIILHTDQPPHDPKSKTKLYTAPRNRNHILTCCVVLSDGYTADTGATYVVPGSHRLRRHPDPAAMSHVEDIADPILAEQGDAACWDSNVWHAFGVRQIPGERIVLHISYCHRDGGEAHDEYDGVSASAFMGKPWESALVQLLERAPATGEVGTANPRRQRLYWEEASLRFMELLPASVGQWMFRAYLNYEVKKGRSRLEQPGD